MEKEDSSPKNRPGNKISRKEALQKAGKYAAFTAASMMLLMSPAESSAATMSSPNAPMRPKRH